ncbi:nucleoside/nucleotide kinase family protein [Nocardioides sp. CER19]|uniref:nucleoside/nucleotide kinase family protein n=1 Tax=Nocardioides sp. CER19 TaxID=3038538 RepID=UPI002449E5FD|nr:nucleoside/nucleotide kinase family protein [Nocardioides sp. CER19]MDH2414917.1 nucleoside/nucleotide kinase family protein [Nocardioides sp. CER19]
MPARPGAVGPPHLVLPDFDAVVRRARAVAGDAGRHVIGITGSPGAGKTTLALALVGALNASAPDRRPWVTHVPMDGFHLADVELTRLGRLDRKGAPDTFDAEGYAALLERLRDARDGETVYAPAFDRDIEQPVAGAIPVPPDCRLVVTEGNYLLVDEPRWRRARAALDEAWFCDLDDETRRRRLVERHVEFGKTRAQAEAWVAGVDEPNAVAIAATRAFADVVVAASASEPR